MRAQRETVLADPIDAAFIRGGTHLAVVHPREGFAWDVRPRTWARHACAVAGHPLTPSEWSIALPQHEYAPACDHCAFFQADVGDLPVEFTGAFDLVYSSLAHHHYPDPPMATSEVLRCLRPGGLYCVVDPGPAWFTRLSAPLAKQTDPGWIGFHTPSEFRRLFEAAGFARMSWRELLPGFGLAVGQKASGL